MRRLLFISVVFAIELTVLSLSVDGQSLLDGSGFAAQLLGAWGMPVTHFLVSLAALGGTFTYLKRRPALETFLQDLVRTPVRAWVVLLHLALFGGLMAVGQRLYTSEAILDGGHTGRLVAAFLALAAAVLASGMAVVQPLAVWGRLARSVGMVWAYAAGPALAAVLMTAGWRALWRPASVVTYWLVQVILRPLVGKLIAEPDRMRIATGRFGVIISPECSGMEGMGLLLVFGGVWLWLYRKECRFPQAFLLLPVGMLTLFVLNSVRIAMLVLIGHAGARQIAAQGFHSQAGWIAFNGVAFGLCVAAGKIPWIAEARPEQPEKLVTAVNLVAVYLGPFLAILAGGMLARTMTGSFEWTYPLRVVAPCAVFWVYRRQYRSMDWRFTWRGPALGLLAFATWMALEWAIEGWPAEAAPPALQMAPGPARWGWIVARLLGAVVAVPLAEELAFRGYLIRRLATEEFDRLPPAQFTIWTLVASSVLFGAMHGTRWMAGIAAGLLYALAYLRKGQLADAVMAHAVTNGLIAAVVLGLGWWKLW